jgi:DNA-binding winged helix-turn-helix (wHTH) protein
VAVNSMKPDLFRFGSFEFDPQTGELRKQGIRIRLEGQPVTILATLLKRRGEVVTREELQQTLWLHDTFVDFEQSLNAAVRRLRLALDDSAESPRYIETLARRGYRWIAPLRAEPVLAASQDSSANPESAIPTRRRSRAIWLALTACVAAAAIFFAAKEVRSRQSSRKVMLIVLPFQNLSEDPRKEYFADGIEEMITHLGSLDPQHLGVIARTSAMQYKGSQKSTVQIARELNVGYLLEGNRLGGHVLV